MHNVFISYHHANDQFYKDELVKFGENNHIFHDGSVDTGDISDDLTDEQIRVKIRDEYLKTTSITILLVGSETKHRKHIDWELYSSMHDGIVNKKSGIVVVLLPTIQDSSYTIPFENEKQILYPNTSWIKVNSKEEYEQRYPSVPERIIDNLLSPNVKITVTSWDKIMNVENLSMILDDAYDARLTNDYNLSKAMRRRNS